MALAEAGVGVDAFCGGVLPDGRISQLVATLIARCNFGGAGCTAFDLALNIILAVGDAAALNRGISVGAGVGTVSLALRGIGAGVDGVGGDAVEVVGGDAGAVGDAAIETVGRGVGGVDSIEYTIS